MQEKDNGTIKDNPEQQRSAQELEKVAQETHTLLNEQLRQNVEKSSEQNPDKARHEVERITTEAEEKQRQEQQKTASAEKVEQKPLTKRDINKKYKETMTNMQSQLPKSSRAFSKVIHNPVVEKTSEVIGNTVARPNLVISGAIGSLASVVVYVIARKYGYELSGFETIGFFILGWTIGAVIEYARVGFLNRS